MDTSKIVNLGFVALISLLMLIGSVVWSINIEKIWPLVGNLAFLVITLLLLGRKIFPKIE